MKIDYAMLGIILVLVAGSIINHELTHKTIYTYYGCDNQGTEFSTWKISSVADCPADVTRDVIASQSVNEVVGYNVVPLLLVMISVMLLGGRS